jgi:hypothetical protein
MWKDVIKSIYNTKYSTIIPQDHLSSIESTWSCIVNHYVKDNRLQDIVNHQSVMLVDNGKRIKFWLDDWTNNGNLAE